MREYLSGLRNAMALEDGAKATKEGVREIREVATALAKFAR